MIFSSNKAMAEIQIIADQGRPYEPLGMTTAKWKDISPKLVNIGLLVFQQDQLSVEGLLAAAKGEPSYAGDEYPHIVKYENQLLVDDGHHRIMVELIRGKKIIEARILEK